MFLLWPEVCGANFILMLVVVVSLDVVVVLGAGDRMDWGH